jgi:hypothetical protein
MLRSASGWCGVDLVEVGPLSLDDASASPALEMEDDTRRS